VIWVLACLGTLPFIAAGALLLCQAGIRAGDRPGDATVSAGVGIAEQPDGRYRVVIVTVRNPGDVPVMVGLSVRRSGLLARLGGGATVTVPRRTMRARLLASQQSVVGVAGPSETAAWAVPVPPAARGRPQLVAVLGQPGRLRVVRLPADQPAARHWPARPPRQPQAW
jgi:hypothetical protein